MFQRTALAVAAALLFVLVAATQAGAQYEPTVPSTVPPPASTRPTPNSTRPTPNSTRPDPPDHGGGQGQGQAQSQSFGGPQAQSRGSSVGITTRADEDVIEIVFQGDPFAQYELVISEITTAEAVGGPGAAGAVVADVGLPLQALWSGTAISDADGLVRFSVPVTALGVGTFRADVYDAAGNLVDSNQFTITAADYAAALAAHSSVAGPIALARTGTDAIPVARAGVVLVFAGTMALLVARRTRLRSATP